MQTGNAAVNNGVLRTRNNVLPHFQIVQRKIDNHNEFQFYFNWGVTEAGPWAKVGINDTEYVVGFVPQPVRRPAQHRRPTTQTKKVG